MRARQWLGLGLFVLGLGTGLPQAAAGPVQVRDGTGGNVFDGGPGYRALTIKVDDASMNVAAGAFALQYRQGDTGAWTGFLTYCLEPDEHLGISGTTAYGGSLVGNLAATAEYAGTAGRIARLSLTWLADSFTSALKSAAFQIALWEIAYDTGSNLATGAFQLVGGADVRAQAEAYLDEAHWQAGGTVGAILRNGNQDLLIRIAEPAALGLFAVALAGLGLIMWRRRGAWLRT